VTERRKIVLTNLEKKKEEKESIEEQREKINYLSYFFSPPTPNADQPPRAPPHHP
jgi:hypothetical protein